MKKYILVYRIDDVCDGNTYACDFPTEKEMHEKVQELNQKAKDKLEIIYACRVGAEYRYKPIEYAVHLEPQIVNTDIEFQNIRL